MEAGGDGSSRPLHVSVAPRSAHSCATSASRAGANLLSLKVLRYRGDWGSEDNVAALPGQRDGPVCVARLANGAWLLPRAQGVRIASPVQEKVSGQQARGAWPWAAGRHLTPVRSPMQSTAPPEIPPQGLAQHGCKDKVSPNIPTPGFYRGQFQKPKPA